MATVSNERVQYGLFILLDPAWCQMAGKHELKEPYEAKLNFFNIPYYCMPSLLRHKQVGNQWEVFSSHFFTVRRHFAGFGFKCFCLKHLSCHCTGKAFCRLYIVHVPKLKWTVLRKNQHLQCDRKHFPLIHAS